MVENGITSGTGQGLVNFLAYAGTKSLLNRNTAGALRSAAKEVLEVENEDLAGIDVRKLDVEELVRRFANHGAGRYTPNSLETYQSRFRRAVQMYLRYLENPAGWKPEIRERTPSSSARPKTSTGGTGFGGGDPLPPPPSSGMIQYPFPIRKDIIASLTLPSDLRAVEAKRLASFLDSLAVDEPKALSAGGPRQGNE